MAAKITLERELRTEINIDASAERVWSVLTDFASYPAWNPLIRRMSGVPQMGARLKAHVQAPGRRGITLHPTVITCVPNRELRLRAHLLAPSFFEAEHSLEIEPNGPIGVRFVHCERFTGLLVLFLRRLIDIDTRRGFEAMDRALKETAEHA